MIRRKCPVCGERGINPLNRTLMIGEFRAACTLCGTSVKAGRVSSFLIDAVVHWPSAVIVLVAIFLIFSEWWWAGILLLLAEIAVVALLHACFCTFHPENPQPPQ